MARECWSDPQCEHVKGGQTNRGAVIAVSIVYLAVLAAEVYFFWPQLEGFVMGGLTGLVYGWALSKLAS